MRITVSKQAIAAHGGSAAAAARSMGVPMSAIRTVVTSPGKDAVITLRPRNAERKHVARGLPGGAMKPKKGKGSYSRKGVSHDDDS